MRRQDRYLYQPPSWQTEKAPPSRTRQVCGKARKCCHPATVKERARRMERRNPCCCRFCCVLVMLLILLLLAIFIMALVFENYCHGEEAKTIITHVVDARAGHQSTSIDLDNRTPHGSLSVWSRADITQTQVQVVDYASDATIRKEMTSIEDASDVGGAVQIESKPYHFASILGFDVSCEKAHQELQTIPGATVDRLKLAAFFNAKVNISIPPEQRFVGGKSGLRAGNVSVAAETGAVLVTGIDVQDTMQLSTTYQPASLLIENLSPRSRQRHGRVQVGHTTARRVLIHTKGGRVDVSEVDIRPAAGRTGGTEADTITDEFYGAGDAGIVVTTSSGDVVVEDTGKYGSITVKTGTGDVHIVLSGRHFAGRYNLQTQEGLVYVNPTNNMHAAGPECSADASWMGLPTLHTDVSRMNGHCMQGQIGFRYGSRRLVVLSQGGDIDVFVRGDYPG